MFRCRKTRHGENGIGFNFFFFFLWAEWFCDSLKWNLQGAEKQ